MREGSGIIQYFKRGQPVCLGSSSVRTAGCQAARVKTIVFHLYRVTSCNSLDNLKIAMEMRLGKWSSSPALFEKQLRLSFSKDYFGIRSSEF